MSQAVNPISAKPMSHQKRAFVFVLAAWIIGTVLFESGAFGDTPEFNSQDSRESLVHRTLDRYATSEVIGTTELRRLASLNDYDKISAQLDKMIQDATAEVAAASKPKVARRTPTVQMASVRVQSNARSKPDLCVDPVISVMPFWTWSMRMDYRSVNRNRQPRGVYQTTYNRVVMDIARASSLPGLVRLATE